MFFFGLTVTTQYILVCVQPESLRTSKGVRAGRERMPWKWDRECHPGKIVNQFILRNQQKIHQNIYVYSIFKSVAYISFINMYHKYAIIYLYVSYTFSIYIYIRHIFHIYIYHFDPAARGSFMAPSRHISASKSNMAQCKSGPSVLLPTPFQFWHIQVRMYKR